MRDKVSLICLMRSPKGERSSLVCEIASEIVLQSVFTLNGETLIDTPPQGEEKRFNFQSRNVSPCMRRRHCRHYQAITVSNNSSKASS
uniref:Uncharacterized protein n=1 Tax=Cannabis sativa TaxID=3483 RepID=A0A803QY31_CANSA